MRRPVVIGWALLVAGGWAPSLKDVPDDYADGYVVQVLCDYGEARDTAVAR
ncbi:hypothetical protein ACFTXO_35580 [Streptomyces sp. NPDC057067]|uniref:hypothetical protein n=1 Tax=unclassified Streptomyces TaxID=2593676 RepID=UPI001F50B00A|nr:hypothetical protein [Streptomyces sp. M3]